MNQNDRRASIVEYWRAVEMFSPQSVPKYAPRQRVYRVDSASPLPWEADHQLARVRLDRDKTWRHTVYVGIYSVARVYEILQRELSVLPDPDKLDAYPPGESAFAAFTVSASGQLLAESDVMSSCAWAVGRLLKPGPNSPTWLDGWAEAQEAWRRRLEEIVAATEADESRERPEPGQPVGSSLKRESLTRILSDLRYFLGVEELLPTQEIRIRSLVVNKTTANKVDGSDFLNSFILDDLQRVATSLRTGTCGQGLLDYLAEESNSNGGSQNRIDVDVDLSFVFQSIAPDNTPLGHWPSNPAQALALGQQLAINTLMPVEPPRRAVPNYPSAATATFAVNGPPGTGKTTLLRDVVAAIVVKRANQLASLKNPNDAFVGTKSWQTGPYRRTVQLWNDKLTGFEMVVSSSNNGAVQNVTDEIPGRKAVDGMWVPDIEQLDYFQDIASALLEQEEQETVSTDEPDSELSANDKKPMTAWALVAARLGNKANRTRFVSAFWFDRQEPKQLDRLGNTSSSDEGQPPVGSNQAKPPATRRGIQSILQSFEGNTPSIPWSVAVTEYQAVRDHVKAAQQERSDIYESFGKINQAKLEQTSMAAKAQSAERDAANANQTRVDCGTALASNKRDLDSAVSRRRQHREFRPNWIESLFTGSRKMREWNAADKVFAEEVQECEEAIAGHEAQLVAAGETEERATQWVQWYRAKEQSFIDEQSSLAKRVDAARAKWGVVPTAEWWSSTDDARNKRELTTLWTDPEWNRLRTELFIAALRLHKAFLQHVPKKMRQSLHGAKDILSGEAPRDIAPEAALAAWQSLFFVVPVVSTTFASLGRVFSHLGPEAFGWLFIDEAGQATPQNPVGAVWRAKRAVIVGDPLQLEPIVSLPFTSQEALRRRYGVSDKWTPGAASAQTIADQLNVVGTTMELDEKKIWVGAPLRVHRRCDDPMFTIVNKIAYQEKMIQGIARRDPFIMPNTGAEAPSSRWINVVSSVSQGHWVPDEGKALTGVLADLKISGQPFSEVFVITPFRDVARELRGIVRQFSDEIESGTVHTAQGKEADIVIVVLGGDPQKDGAKAWAASKPNLANVAISRARRRICVIGNYSKVEGPSSFLDSCCGVASFRLVGE